MTQVRKAVWYSIISQYMTLAISFISVAVLARLLTPDEIGVFSVATSIAYLAIELRAFGANEFLVREPKITAGKVQAVLGVMVITSWGLAFILLMAAPWIADFYKEEDLKYILWIIAVPFFLAPYTGVPYALLVREMNFEAILKINMTSAVVRNVSSIMFVLYGFGYYGLAYGTLLGVLSEFVAAVYLSPSSMEWKPAFRNIKRIFGSGAQISLARFLESSSNNSSDLVLGRVLTMNDVGLYSRGLGLLLFLQGLLIKAVGPVGLPHLSQVRRDGGDMKEAYLTAISLVGAFALPLFAVVNLSAYSMINALFGDQWNASVKIASILTIWAMLQSVHCFAAPALIAMGKERLFLVWQLVSFLIKIVLVVMAAPRGLEAVAWAFVLSGVFDFVLVTILVGLIFEIRMSGFAKAIVPNLVVAMACWGVLKIIMMYFSLENLNDWIALVVIGATMFPVWLVSLRMTNNNAWPLVRDFLVNGAKKSLSFISAK